MEYWGYLQNNGGPLKTINMRGGGWGEGSTLLCLGWRTNKDLLPSTGSSAQCCVAAGTGEGSVGEGPRGCVCLRPCAVRLKLSQRH